MVITSVDIAVSGNILKNVKSVKVPNTGGLSGIGAAVSILLTIVMPSALDKLRGFHLDKFIVNWRKSNERMEHEVYPELPKKHKK